MSNNNLVTNNPIGIINLTSVRTTWSRVYLCQRFAVSRLQSWEIIERKNWGGKKRLPRIRRLQKPKASENQKGGRRGRERSLCLNLLSTMEDDWPFDQVHRPNQAYWCMWCALVLDCWWPHARGDSCDFCGFFKRPLQLASRWQRSLLPSLH